MSSMPSRSSDDRNFRNARTLRFWISAPILAVVVLAGCSIPVQPPVSIGPDIAVPAGELRPVDRCMHDAGFDATAVHPGRAGSNGAYSWATTTWYTWEAAHAGATGAAGADCANRFVTARDPTVDELRQTYDRWVLERHCLMSLGFQPTSPPPFDEFVATWHTGPWMPIDGVDYRAIQGDAKDRCGVEMVD